MDPFVGEIRLFAGNFAPRNWAFCDGQLIAVNQNDALFSLLGTIYGGDGRTTFGLPDIRGRIPIHMGTGPGLSPRTIGQKSGQEQVQIGPNHLPDHTHNIVARTSANTTDPSGASFGVPATPAYAPPGNSMEMNRRAVAPAGSGTGTPFNHNNVQPFGCIHFIISLFGIYPSQH